MHSHSLQSPNRIHLYRIYIGLLRYCRVMDSDSESEFSDQKAKEGPVQEVFSKDQQELVVDAGVEDETLMEDTVLTPQRNNRIECDSEHSRSCSEACSEVDLLGSDAKEGGKKEEENRNDHVKDKEDHDENEKLVRTRRQSILEKQIVTC